MNLALAVNNLRKCYGGVTAINNLSFQVKEGEIFGLLGPNGAGKTTTLECIEGVKAYDRGTIEIFGENANKNRDIYKTLGVQLQSASLQGSITAMEAMTLFCKWQGVPIRMDLLDTFGFKDNYKKQYSTMSTGQKRRLHLALAIAHNPKLLILDEPTAGLDVEGRISLHNEIRKLKKLGVTIILASHDMAEVEALCDTIAIIIKGEIAKVGTPSEIITAGNKAKRILIKTLNNTLINNITLKESEVIAVSDQYITLAGEDAIEALSEILYILKESKDTIIDLKIEQPSLEERFIEIIKKESEVR